MFLLLHENHYKFWMQYETTSRKLNQISRTKILRLIDEMKTYTRTQKPPTHER